MIRGTDVSRCFSPKDTVLSHKRILFLLPVLFFLTLSAGQIDEQVYIIRKGDTLWDLAFRFLGDPFAWPQIWHQNPYIKDPNLIFPGDKLTISKLPAGQPQPLSAAGGTGLNAAFGASSSLTGTSASDDSFSSETRRAIEQSEALGQKALLKKGKDGRLSDTLFSLAVKRSGYFTSDFLGKAGFLWFGKDEKGLISPGAALILKKQNNGAAERNEQETYQEFDDISLSPLSASKNPFHAGDTVDILHSYRFVNFGSRTANLVRRTGHARITGIKGTKITAVLFEMWDVVESGDRVDTMAHFSDMRVDTIVDPPVAIRGTIFLHVEDTERPALYHTCILDRGAKDGVVVGDIFALISGRTSPAGRTEALASAVNIGETSSTLVIEKLFDNGVNVGDTAVIIKRIQFKN
jgi:LysM domain